MTSFVSAPTAEGEAAVLRVLRASPIALRQNELMARTGVPKTQILAVTADLQSRGMLVFDEGYRLFEHSYDPKDVDETLKPRLLQGLAGRNETAQGLARVLGLDATAVHATLAAMHEAGEIHARVIGQIAVYTLAPRAVTFVDEARRAEVLARHANTPQARFRAALAALPDESLVEVAVVRKERTPVRKESKEKKPRASGESPKKIAPNEIPAPAGYVTAREARRRYDVKAATLWNWAQEGRVGYVTLHAFANAYLAEDIVRERTTKRPRPPREPIPEVEGYRSIHEVMREFGRTRRASLKFLKRNEVPTIVQDGRSLITEADFQALRKRHGKPAQPRARLAKAPAAQTPNATLNAAD